MTWCSVLFIGLVREVNDGFDYRIGSVDTEHYSDMVFISHGSVILVHNMIYMIKNRDLMCTLGSGHYPI